MSRTCTGWVCHGGKDPGETADLAEEYPEEVQRLTKTLNGIIQSGRSRAKAS